MNQQPDKVFRDKLQNYQKDVPSSAWDRISASQVKKKQPGNWLKIAASLLLVGCAGATWMLTRSDIPGKSIADKNQSANIGAPSKPNADVTAESAETGPSDITASEENVRKKIERADNITTANNANAQQTQRASTGHPVQIANTHKTNADNVAATRNNTTAEASAEIIESTDDSIKNNNPIADGTPVTTNGKSITPNRVTLTYTVEDVSAYLEKNIDDDATEEEKKQSTLKKLLQKANDLKTNQDPFAELRQRKNEILALNFMNDKRGQKTRN